MTDFKAIKGFSVKSLAADPLPGGGVVGGTWSSGGALNTARNQLAGAGTKAAGIVFAGDAGGSALTITEKYDGSAWTEVNDLNTGRTSLAGSGTQTATLAIAGAPNRAINESFNGTSWTEVGDLNNGRNALYAVGTSTASLAFGGTANHNESWNGTAWTELSNLNTARSDLSGAGTTTSALAYGGESGLVNTENFNGTSWTEVNDLSTGIFGGWGSGIATSALLFGGKTPAPAFTTKAEFFNGTSWAETGSMATAITQSGGSVGGTGTTALQAGGDNADGYKDTTQEFTAGGIGDTIKNEGQVYYNSTAGTMNVTAVVFGTGTWASGGAMNTARNRLAGAGTQTAGLAFGGETASLM